MDIQMSYIVAPCLGGLIGYITNDIAIRMLFHPHKAKYIMGWHVPFTPGIIPKEKGRIAEAIGVVISENLMNKEVLEKYLLSEDMIGKLRDAVMDFIDTQNHDEQLNQAVNATESIYRTVISEHPPRILESIDISKIVRERINEMDVKETEKLIFQVMDKELKAIVWLGALLGLIMGSLNTLIQVL